ncbi:hypothetical protein [Sandaracinus amylolyticus]|uniref:hypothetical protein n=1 Tax=Sandaracinus amylolyticus TaxID=927083 RepID=UPI001F3F689A|nr:hypothetical protein [Sandaracinus amylolyticus]
MTTTCVVELVDAGALDECIDALEAVAKCGEARPTSGSEAVRQSQQAVAAAARNHGSGVHRADAARRGRGATAGGAAILATRELHVQRHASAIEVVDPETLDLGFQCNPRRTFFSAWGTHCALSLSK